MGISFLQRFFKVALVASCLTACAQADKPYSEIISAGNLSSGQYSNSFFKFKIRFPEKWIMASHKELLQRKQMGLELLNADSLIDENKNTDPRFFFSIDKYRQDAPEMFKESAGFQMSFLKKKYLSANNGKEFLEHARKLVSGKEFIKPIGDIGNTKIGGKDFASNTTEIHLKGFVIHQQSFIADINDCLFIIDMSWRAEEESHLKVVEKDLSDILSSLTFY